MYKKNPRSKVFAPLAESFRKLGMLEDAFKILKDGIRNHPNYTLGYIVLANCYFDQGKFELTYNTLRPIVAQNADNISLQKIFAQACLNLGNLEEALDTYKYLLFMNPRDKFFSDQVKKLEDDLFVGHKKLSLDQLIKAPEMESKLPAVAPSIDDDWVQVDFNQAPGQISEEETKKITEAASDSEWVMQKPGSSHKPLEEKTPEPAAPIIQKPVFEEEEKPFITRGLDDDFYADEFEEFGDIEETDTDINNSGTPIVSHTLIDLYCAQQYFDKAIELLEKILELNPQDRSSQDKLAQVLQMKKAAHPKSVPAASKKPAPLHIATAAEVEQEGHEELISIIENQVKAKSPQEMKLKETFDHFLLAIKERAQSYR